MHTTCTHTTCMHTTHHTHAHHLHLHHMHTTCLRTCVHMNTAAGHRAAELQPLRWLLPADQPHLGRGMRRALADPVHMTCAARCSVVQRTHSACALIPSACPSPCPCTCICPCPCARCSGQVQQLHVALAMREGAVVGVACLALVARSKRAPAPWGAEVLRVSRASYSLLYVVSTQST